MRHSVAFFGGWLAVLAMTVMGCSGLDGVGQDDPLLGKWTGSVGGLELNFDLNTAYPDAGGGYYSGSLRTSDASCFTAGMLVARRTQGTVSLTASGSGGKSQTSIVRVTGELAGPKIVGLLSITGDVDSPCTYGVTDLVVYRQ
jgi:hypothetical protein